MNTTATINATAAAILTNTLTTIANYQAKAAEYADQGLRPERCIHGASLWVDHDIPCGACEAGEDPADLTVADALAAAQDRLEAADQAATAYVGALRHALTLVRNADVTDRQRARYWVGRMTESARAEAAWAEKQVVRA